MHGEHHSLERDQSQKGSLKEEDKHSNLMGSQLCLPSNQSISINQRNEWKGN